MTEEAISIIKWGTAEGDMTIITWFVLYWLLKWKSPFRHASLPGRSEVSSLATKNSFSICWGILLGSIFSMSSMWYAFWKHNDKKKKYLITEGGTVLPFFLLFSRLARFQSIRQPDGKLCVGTQSKPCQIPLSQCWARERENSKMATSHKTNKNILAVSLAIVYIRGTSIGFWKGNVKTKECIIFGAGRGSILWSKLKDENHWNWSHKVSVQKSVHWVVFAFFA